MQPGITIPRTATGSPSREAWSRSSARPDEPTILGQFSSRASSTRPACKPLGDNLFAETPASGAPQRHCPDADGAGTLLQGYLEQSNVNAVTEITDLIAAQRAYEMNSKVITAADEMLQSTTQPDALRQAT